MFLAYKSRPLWLSGLGALISVVGLASCSAHVDGGSGVLPGAGAPPARQFADPRATIAGPAVTGHWLSACHQAPEDTQTYRSFDLVFTDKEVTRTETTFSDRQCATLTQQKVLKGRYRFVGKFADGGFNIEYAFDVPKGATAFPQEEILVVSNNLLLSNLDPKAPILKDEPLILVGPPSTPTTPTILGQVQKTAVIAPSYSSAGYAFCSTQNIGVMIDFTGANLNTDGSGIARIGSKACGSGQGIQWNANPVHYTVTMTGGRPNIDFTDSGVNGSPDYIHPAQYQNGLLRGAFSILQGNSGECFFLANDGTQNLSFTYGCE